MATVATGWVAWWRAPRLPGLPIKISLTPNEHDRAMDSLPNLGLLGLSKARGAPPDERKFHGRAVVDYREARLVAREKEMEKARALFECALKLSFLRAPRETPALPYPPNIFTPDIVLSQNSGETILQSGNGVCTTS